MLTTKYVYVQFSHLNTGHYIRVSLEPLQKEIENYNSLPISLSS